MQTTDECNRDKQLRANKTGQTKTRATSQAELPGQAVAEIKHTLTIIRCFVARKNSVPEHSSVECSGANYTKHAKALIREWQECVNVFGLHRTELYRE